MYTSNLHVRALTDFCFELNRSSEKVLCRFSLLSCQLFRSGFNPCLINGQGPDLREDQLYCHSDIQGGKMSFFCWNLGLCSVGVHQCWNQFVSFLLQLLDGDAMCGHHDRALGACGVGARCIGCSRQRFQYGPAVATRRESRKGLFFIYYLISYSTVKYSHQYSQQLLFMKCYTKKF